MKSRAVAIIIDRATMRVLLIHRFRVGREYYVLPGGKIEEGETPAQACAREVREETGLEISVGPFVAELYNQGREEYYFLAKQFTGQLQNGFVESVWASSDNVYELEWVAWERLAEIRLLPEEIRGVILKNLT